MGALRAAGLNGTAPAGAGAFKTLVSTLTSNWKWLIGTGRGSGAGADRRVDDRGLGPGAGHLFRVIGGIMLILVVIPAVLA